MERAVIAIGVKKTGQLPELQAAVDSATSFATWARDKQKVPASRVKLITDAKGAVSRDRIFDTVERITKLGFIEQLIVYFSGHGINSGMFEQWLLSRAPDDPAAAVNVKGSEFGARFCGIGHVVFISDACRTAADNIQAQRVTGADIFPNAKPAGLENPVDQFYATLVGNPAYEVKTVQESTARYQAAYSTVLMEALAGKVPTLVESSDTAGYVRPRPLKRHLATAVPRFFSTLNLAGGESSQPDARIESDADAWIAELPLAAAPSRDATLTASIRSGLRRAARRLTPGLIVGDDDLLPPLAVELDALSGATLESQVSFDLRAALDPLGAPRSKRATVRGRPSLRAHDNKTKARYDELVTTGRTSFGPDHMESRCGIKVRGLRIAESYARYAQAAVGAGGDIVRVDLPADRKGANVLVQLVDGSVVVAPAYRDFITGLSFDTGGNLEDVWCEPSANTPRWVDYQVNIDEVRALRALVAASSALGVFRLEGADEGAALLNRLRNAKTVDPAMAVYAAYAFNDRRMRSHIVDMQRHLDEGLGVRIFDVAMLAFSLSRDPKRGEPREMYPCVPMLTQGWALLSPLSIVLPGGLDQLRAELRPSLWTHFAPAAADRLRHVLKEGLVG